MSEPEGFNRCTCRAAAMSIGDRGLITCKICKGWLCLIIYSKEDLEHAYNVIAREKPALEPLEERE